MEEERKRRVPKWLKGILWGGLALTAAYVGFVGFAWTKRVLLEGAVEGLGISLNPDYYRPIEVPAEQNGATLLREVAKAIREYERAEEYQIEPAVSLDRMEYYRGEALLDMLDEALTMDNHQMIEREAEGSFVWSYGGGWVGDLTRGLGRLALDQASAGDIDAAWESVDVNLRIIAKLKNERDARQLYVRNDVIDYPLVALFSLMHGPVPSDVVVEDILLTLMKFESRATLHDAFDAWWVNLYQEREKEFEYLDNMNPVYEAIARHRPVEDLDRAIYLERYLAFREEFTKWPYEESGEDVYLMNAPAIPELLPLSNAADYIAEDARERLLKTIVRVKLFRAAVALLQFQEKQGRFPADLSDLNQDALFDPFSGKDLIYQPGEDGFFLYSFGPNKKDEGGRADDIFLRYPRLINHGEQ